MSAKRSQPARRRPRSRRPAGAWSRFAAALTTLVLLGVGVPVALVLSCRAGLGASHPLPGLGSLDEIRAYFRRGLTPTEIAPIAMRSLLVVAWALWLAMVTTVLGSIIESASGRRVLPQAVMFAGLGRWIAAGLTVFSALTPTFASAATITSPRPFTVSSSTAAPGRMAAVAETPVASGSARVRAGESAELFARRTLGDAARWREVWELNQHRPVGPAGEQWSTPWKLGVGWDLVLPAGADPTVQPTDRGPLPPAPASDAESYLVVEGDSYWAIAERHLGVDALASDVLDYTTALLDANAPRLGYDDPALLHPGDRVDLVAPTTSSGNGTEPDDGASPTPNPTPNPTTTTTTTDASSHTVVVGDSYWAIAEADVGDDASVFDVVTRTHELMAGNADRFGYDDPRMIHPGDVVDLGGAPSVASSSPSPLPPPDASVPTTTDPPPTTLPALPALPAPTTPPPSTTSTTSTTVAAADGLDGSGSTGATERPSPATPIGLTEAALVTTGVLALIGARRRTRLRAAEPPARVPLPSAEAVAMERSLRRLDGGERLLRVDVSLRSAAQPLVDRGARIEVVRSSPDGAIEIMVSRPVELPSPWVGADRRWRLSAHVSPESLAASARPVGAPCVAIAQIGVDDEGWDVLVDLEALRVLSIDAGGDTGLADAVTRAVLVGVASAELAEVAHVIGVGDMARAGMGQRQVHAVESVDEGVELAATLVGATVSARSDTFSLRTRHTGGEHWEPAVVFVGAAHVGEVSRDVLDVVGRGHGLAMVLAGRSTDDRPGGWTLTGSSSQWVLQPLGLKVSPIGIDVAGIELLDELTDLVVESDTARSLPVRTAPPAPVETEPALQHRLFVPIDPRDLVIEVEDSEADSTGGLTRSDEDRRRADDDVVVSYRRAEFDGAPGEPISTAPELDLEMPPTASREPDADDEASVAGSADHGAETPPVSVRLLGAPEVVAADGTAARFERSKALELLTWLVTHRMRSTRQGARTALWDQDVRDATFANVVSDARRTTARLVPCADDDEWLRRTLTDELSLHDGVRSDADMVRAALDAARGLAAPAVVALLAPAVEAVRGMPFADTGYLWPDAEGITTDLILLTTSVCAEHARAALEVGDVEGVFWSTGRGLQVISGQETLIGLRMQAHAAAGDLSGVRREWESYERVVTADPWSDGELAPKLVALRKRLLSPPSPLADQS